MKLLWFLLLTTRAASAQPAPADEQVWWSLADHEAREVLGYGDCREIHAELSEAGQRARSVALDGITVPSQRRMMVEMASQLAPWVFSEVDDLPRGACVAVGSYEEHDQSDLRLFVVRFIEASEFTTVYVFLGGR